MEIADSVGVEPAAPKFNIRDYLNVRMAVRLVNCYLAYATLRLYWVYGGEFSVLGMLFPALVCVAFVWAAYAAAKTVIDGTVDSGNPLPPRPTLAEKYESPAWQAMFAVQAKRMSLKDRYRGSVLNVLGLFFWLGMFGFAHVFVFPDWAIDGERGSVRFIAHPSEHRITRVQREFYVESFQPLLARTKDAVLVEVRYRVKFELQDGSWADVERRNDPVGLHNEASRTLENEIRVLIASYAYEELQEDYLPEHMLSRALKHKFDETGYGKTKVDLLNVQKSQQ